MWYFRVEIRLDAEENVDDVKYIKPRLITAEIPYPNANYLINMTRLVTMSKTRYIWMIDNILPMVDIPSLAMFLAAFRSACISKPQPVHLNV